MRTRRDRNVECAVPHGLRPAQWAARPTSPSGMPGSARRSRSTTVRSRTSCCTASMVSQTLTCMPASTRTPVALGHHPEGHELVARRLAAQDDLGAGAAGDVAGILEPDVVLVGEEERDGVVGHVLRPAIERPAARPPSLALAQCSTRTVGAEGGALPVGDVAGRPDALRRRAQRVVGDDAVVDVEARALGETGVGGDAHPDDDGVGRAAASPARGHDRLDAAVSPSMRSTPSPKRKLTPCEPVQLREPAADLLPHDAEQRRGLRLDDGHRAARVAGSRSNLEADPAGADDDDPGAVDEARLEGRPTPASRAGRARRRDRHRARRGRAARNRWRVSSLLVRERFATRARVTT